MITILKRLNLNWFGFLFLVKKENKKMADGKGFEPLNAINIISFRD